MNISELSNSRYLKQSDVPEPKLLTIKEVTKENVAPQNQKPQIKGVIYFEELDKPMVAGPVNLQLAQMAFKSGETDDWIGKKIVLYIDPTVVFGGEITGGLRLRAPKGNAAPVKKPTIEELDNDIPF